MDIWVITDPATEVIYGTAEANSRTHAVVRAEMGKARWFGSVEPPRGQQLSAHPLFAFAGDRRWRELAPVGAEVAGQCGGDVQITEAYSRRFALVRPDLTWAVLTHAWYGINETTGYVDEQTTAEVVERHDEFLVVADPHNLDDAIWEDDERDTEYDPEPSEAGVRKHAETYSADWITWGGDPE